MRRSELYSTLTFFVVGLALVGTDHVLHPDANRSASGRSIYGVAFEGTVHPASEVHITASPSGTVSKTSVKVCDRVQQGQELLRRNDREAELTVQQAGLELDAARAKLDRSRLQGGTQWIPPKALTWYWQLSGNVNMTRNVAAYDIDGFDNTTTTVATLHGQGKKVICYFSAGTYEDWRPDASLFPAAALGSGNGWPGEKWLDIRNATVKAIMQVRMQICKDKGFDAIEPDNIDGYTNSTGFPLTAQDQINYNSWIANTAHSLGLAAFLKNDVDQIAILQPYFDGALNEQCAQYSECGGYSAFLNGNKPVLQAEYSGGTSFCADANAAGRMAALFDLDLTGSTFIPCW